MEDNKVVDINEDRVILTNGDIAAFMQNTPVSVAFGKFSNNSHVSGKTQYWLFRIQKKIVKLFTDIEEVRIKLAKNYTEKDEDGELIYIDSQYQFEPEQKILYDEEIKALNLTVVPSETESLIAEKYCNKKANGKPIKIGGNMLKLTEESQKKFTEQYNELMSTENSLPFNRVVVSSTLLEKMNTGKPNPISVHEMILLEKVIKFTE